MFFIVFLHRSVFSRNVFSPSVFKTIFGYGKVPREEKKLLRKKKFSWKNMKEN